MVEQFIKNVKCIFLKNQDDKLCLKSIVNRRIDWTTVNGMNFILVNERSCQYNRMTCSKLTIVLLCILFFFISPAIFSCWKQPCRNQISCFKNRSYRTQGFSCYWWQGKYFQHLRCYYSKENIRIQYDIALDLSCI